MILPLAVLGLCCLLIGLAPGLVAPLLGRGIAAWDPSLPYAGLELARLAPLEWVSIMGLGLLLGLVVCGSLFWLLVRRTAVAAGPTWGCGYLMPTARIQYTASSFAQILVGLFARVLRPHTRRPRVVGLFPRPTGFRSEVPDAVLDGLVLPAFRGSAWLLSWFRFLQQGSIQTYLLYIFLALIALLLWR